jgi:hypothetical protein
MKERYIDPEMVPDAENSWFMLYHMYSTSKKPDKDFKKTIEDEMKLAKKLKIKRVIIEDNYKDFRIGDYDDVWNEDNFRFLIREAHENGIKVYPYVVLVEVATHSNVYLKNRDKWKVRGRFGMELHGFFSLIHGHIYSPEQDHMSALFCPASGWGDYLVDKVKYLLDNFDVDGIYIDRIDYRLNCRNRNHGEKGHFVEGVVDLVTKIADEVHKKKGCKLIVNESRIKTDDYLKKCIKLSDSVLIEALPNDFPNATKKMKLYVYFAPRIVWKIKDKIRSPLKNFIRNYYFKPGMFDEGRMEYLIKRRRDIGAKDITLFSQSHNEEGFNTICHTAKKLGTSICIATGERKLKDVVKQ